MKNLTLLTTVLVSGFSLLVNAQTPNNVPSSGNVGIGTTSPNKKLDVIGESELNGKVTMDSTLIVKDSADFESDVRVRRRFTVEEEAYFLSETFMKSNLYVDSTATFFDKVRIEGILEFDQLDTLSTLNNYDILMVGPSGKVEKTSRNQMILDTYKQPCNNDAVRSGSPQNPTWQNGLYKIFSECPQVNVGIATTEPQFKLDVRGVGAMNRLRLGVPLALTSDQVLIKGYVPVFQPLLQLGTYSGSEETRMELKSDGSLELFHVTASHSWTGKPLTIWHNSNSIFDLNSDGSLELSHFGQGSALIINGSGNDKLLQLESDGLLRARKIRIDLQTWSDYVFDENYPLMSLQELDAYIKEHRHLPGVPSEEQLKEEGMEVAEMNQILMEKVEELTLYVIELEKQMQQIREKM